MPKKKTAKTKINTKKPAHRTAVKQTKEPAPKAPPVPLMQSVVETIEVTTTTPADQTNSPQDQPQFVTVPENPLPSDTPIEQMPPVGTKRSRMLPAAFIAAAILIFSAIGFVGFYYLKSPVKQILPSPTPEISPTPKPEIILNKADFIFEVYNGSGKTGAASKAGKKLEELGYTVTKTGNADKSNYPNSELFVTEGLNDRALLLLTDLHTGFTSASFSGIFTPAENSTATAKLIIGRN